MYVALRLLAVHHASQVVIFGCYKGLINYAVCRLTTLSLRWRWRPKEGVMPRGQARSEFSLSVVFVDFIVHMYVGAINPPLCM